MTVYEKYSNKYGEIEGDCDHLGRDSRVKLNDFELEEVYSGMNSEIDEDKKQYLDLILYLALVRRCYVWISYYLKKANDSETRLDLLQESYLTYARCKELSKSATELSTKFFGKLRENSSRYIDEKTSLVKLTRTAKRDIQGFYQNLERKYRVDCNTFTDISKAVDILESARDVLSEEDFNIFIMYSGVFGKFSYNDIAEKLMIDKKRVNNAIPKIKKKLQKIV